MPRRIKTAWVYIIKYSLKDNSCLYTCKTSHRSNTLHTNDMDKRLEIENKKQKVY